MSQAATATTAGPAPKRVNIPATRRGSDGRHATSPPPSKYKSCPSILHEEQMQSTWIKYYAHTKSHHETSHHETSHHERTHDETSQHETSPKRHKLKNFDITQRLIL
jgi:hypothetical protein